MLELNFIVLFLDYLQAVQAFAVLACLFAVISLCVFLFQLIKLGKGKRFTISGVLQLLSCEYSLTIH